jgi:hypothetical protein
LKADAGRKPDFAGLRPLVLLNVAWEFLLVLGASLYSPPMGSVSSAVGLSPSLMANFPLLDSLFFHALALPLASVLMIVTLGAFGVLGRTRRVVLYAATLGCLLASGMMGFILVTGGSPASYDVMYAGMVLAGVAAVSLLVGLWPKRDPEARMKLAGRSLAGWAMWVTVLAAIVAVSVGSYAATANGQFNPSTVAAEMQGLEAAHETLMITIIGAAVVLLAVKWFDAESYRGTPGLFVKIGLYGTLVGVPIVVATSLWAAPEATGPTGDLNMYVAILLQASLFLMFAMMYEEAKRLHVRGPLGVLRESLTFGMLFVLFWVNIAVTLPGVYVAVNLARFNGRYLGFYYQEVFTIGHEHALITLTAVSLMMLVALMFGVKGILGAVAGLTMTVGYVVATTANLFYIFYLIPNGPTFISYISDGIALMFVGVLLALVGIAISRGGRQAAPDAGEPSVPLPSGKPLESVG